MVKPIKLSEANADFFDRVYQVVKLIPKGRATSYGAIAKYLGAKSGSRMVGWAMNAAHGKDVPAQRVVNRNGQLTGKMHFETPTAMEELLLKDGIEVKDDQIVNWKEVFWDPMTELQID
ncbi:MGMT family protein [Fluviicola sp.]|uniref:MGMT family protein n=1 Tax=Fluviicola sp. TaxID=1917219 RepID=UPI0031D0B86B